MPSILVVGVAAPSHIEPSLPLVRELAARGHDVRYAVDARSAPRVAAAGAEPIVLPTTLPGPAEPWPDEEVAGLGVFLDEAIALLPMLERAVRSGPPPALVLHDVAAIAGPVLAERLGVPAVLLSPAAVAWEGYAADLPAEAVAAWSSPGATRLMERFAAWLAGQGVALTPDAVLSEPRRGLALIPRAMQPHADRVHPRWSFAGPLLDPDRLDPAAWTPPAGGRRILLVAFGTAYDEQAPVHRAAIAGLAGPDWHLVLAIGTRTPPAALGPLPPDGVEVHARVPQLAVLAHADAFVTHAGMGSSAEALWAGVPCVAVPQAVDQFANAARLAELGVGVVLDPGRAAQPEALRAAVAAVADDAGIRARLSAVRAEVRASGSPAHAADLVEAELGAGEAAGG